MPTLAAAIKQERRGAASERGAEIGVALLRAILRALQLELDHALKPGSFLVTPG
jgi:hypothetical protein